MVREGKALAGYNGVTLDLQGLSSGMYVARLSLNGVTAQYAKIVKQ
jgi:hypothetical protein